MEKYTHFINRRRLRAMRRGEMLRIEGLPPGAVCSARVQCWHVGRERGCHYSLTAVETAPERYTIEITRMSFADAMVLGLLRSESADGDQSENKTKRRRRK